MLKTIGIGVLVVAAIAAAVAVYGGVSWNAGTRELRERLAAACIPHDTRHVDFAELDELPDPVQRYFRTVLEDGAPIVAEVRVQHRGTFDMGTTAEQWKPFISDQLVYTRRPGFDWDARIAMAPGVSVRVHDAYVAGEGILRAAVLGLFVVADERGTPEMAEGELMRFFAEAAWYPSALLPGQGVRWAAIDARSARATLVDGPTSITLTFRFGEDGTIETVRADSRGRTVDGRVVPTPWQGRFWNYQSRGGIRVPLDGEVAWLLPEGEKPYWRGRITDIAYEFAH